MEWKGKVIEKTLVYIKISLKICFSDKQVPFDNPSIYRCAIL